MEELIYKALKRAIDEKTLFNIETCDGMFSTHYDWSGQRQCYIRHYSEQHKKDAPCYFAVCRHLTFTNKEDEGKQDAVLCVIDISKINSATHLKIERSRIEIGPFIFRFYKPVL